jgi:hypothetical protein
MIGKLTVIDFLFIIIDYFDFELRDKTHSYNIEKKRKITLFLFFTLFILFLFNLIY